MTTKQAERPVEEQQSGNVHKENQKKDNNTSVAHEQDAAKTTRNKQKKERKEAKRKNKRPRLRIFPIWLRIIVVVLLCAIALTTGVMIGYGVIGDGTPTDALKKETWQHIIDIVTKTE